MAERTIKSSVSLSGGDAWLVARCQDADIVAFDEIVARYKGRIYGYLYRMTGSAEDAEDITQEVFVRMYTNIGSFRAEASLSAWLFRIAGNLAVDAFRRAKNRRTRVRSLDGEIMAHANDENANGVTCDVPDWSREPMTVLARTESGAQIQAALEKLPPKLRSAVVLHDIEGLSYEDIAVVERIPLGTVKSRIFSARAALRKRLRLYWES
jgi:RNA polymerase sigma-70 factor (ECF subfamily)